MWHVSDPLTALALGAVVGAPSALVPHAAKATLRAASTAFTAGFANPVLSLVEDVLAFVMFVMAVLVPILVCLLMVGVALFVARRLWLRSRAAVPVS
jgi:hypothetical protein